MFIDRRNRQRAIQSMNSVAGMLQKYGISVCVFPEGTRSRDGRLQPFKKGAMHMALQAKCPIVPVVINGAHNVSDQKKRKKRKERKPFLLILPST